MCKNRHLHSSFHRNGHNFLEIEKLLHMSGHSLVNAAVYEGDVWPLLFKGHGPHRIYNVTHQVLACEIIAFHMDLLIFYNLRSRS